MALSKEVVIDQQCFGHYAGGENLCPTIAASEAIAYSRDWMHNVWSYVTLAFGPGIYTGILAATQYD